MPSRMTRSLLAGDGFTKTFDSPGSFDYCCAIHPEMKGTVTVEP